MLEGDDISRLLDILGNRNRRRIIQLLRQKPCFVTEISDRLMISPKAVIEHLQLMEREQILLSKNDRSRRKYYYLSRDFKVVIDLENIPAALLPEEIAVIDKKTSSSAFSQRPINSLNPVTVFCLISSTSRGILTEK